MEEAQVTLLPAVEILRAMITNLPTLILFTPLIGLILLTFFPPAKEKAIRTFTLLVTLVVAGEVGYMMTLYDYMKGGFQREFGLMIPWFPQIGAYYHVQVDGISLAMVMLTAILFVAAALGSWSIHFRVKEYSILFLLLEMSIIGVFISMDYFLFFIMWELMLVPMYFLIGIWGGPRRIYAAIKFFLFTLAGSIALLFGILLIYWHSGLKPEELTFNSFVLARTTHQLPLSLQVTAFFLFLLGFGVKVPIVPFHTWLPDAHVEAPTPISVILAGLLLKTGGYGFYRFVFPTFPDAVKHLAILIALIGVVSIVYAALVAMAQADLKTLIAMASVSHMGYVLFGLATQTPEGASAGMFVMVSHGFVSGALFLLTGVIYDRAHTRIMSEFGGLGAVMSTYFAFFGLVGMANLALPGLSGFWGEALAYLGAFRNTFYLWNGIYTFRLLAICAAPAIVITAGYTLWMLQRMFMGPLNETWKHLTDMDRREVLSLAIPSFFIVLFGVLPGLLTNIYNSSLSFYFGRLGLFI